MIAAAQRRDDGNCRHHGNYSVASSSIQTATRPPRGPSEESGGSLPEGPTTRPIGKSH